MAEFFKTLYRGWMKVAHGIGRVNTAILLTLFYFVFLGVAKIVTVLLGKDLLDSAWKDRSSYWRARSDFKIDWDRFLRPY